MKLHLLVSEPPKTLTLFDENRIGIFLLYDENTIINYECLLIKPVPRNPANFSGIDKEIALHRESGKGDPSLVPLSLRAASSPFNPTLQEPS
jgi:hypothetical protein